jgi:thioredoxin 2
MAFYRCTACGAVNRTASGEEQPACARCRCALDTTATPQAVDAAALVSAILVSPAPVLVDFTAPGARRSCLDEVASARAGELLCLRVDPASEPAATDAYQVHCTPTLVLFSDGCEVARLPAAAPSSEISRWLAASGTRPWDSSSRFGSTGSRPDGSSRSH